MSDYIVPQESILPPGFKLQVIFDENGCPSTVPIGTTETKTIGILPGLGYREKIANELRVLMMNQYGYGPGDLRTLCYDVDGNECVVIRARCKPRNNWHEQLQKKPDNLALGTTEDVIDI